LYKKKYFYIDISANYVSSLKELLETLIKLIMSKKANVKRVSLDFPDYILDQIDEICDKNFITRRKWFIDAANEKLEKDNLNKIDMIVRK
jgi:hypothetical protein